MTGFRTSSSSSSRDRGGAGSSLGPRFKTGFAGASAFSHAQILQLMKSEFARGRRYGFPVACVVIEPDGMARLEDRFGPELGEVVVRELSTVVAERTRDSDQLGLVRDNQLLLVLPHTSESAARIVAERIREDFRGLELTVEDQPVQVHLSLGLTGSDHQDTLFFDTMLSQAEVALEWARDDGGDQVVCFRSDRYLAVDAASGEDDAGEGAEPDRDAAGDDPGRAPPSSDTI